MEGIDRTNLKEMVDFKLKSMLDFIEQCKASGHEGITYPWYVPTNTMKHLDGFKTNIFAGLRENGNYVTDFLPGFRPEIGGIMKDIYICWTPEAKAKAESEGLIFRV